MSKEPAGKKISRIAALALAGLALAGCAGIFEPEKPLPAEQMPLLEKRIIALVAERRAKTDPKARIMLVDPALSVIAKKRSDEMARTNSFSSGEDPHVSATMLMNADAKFQGLVGENVAAQRFTAKDGIDVEVFAKRFVDGWTASKPHLENLSFAEYDRTGVGASVNADTVYVAQIFTSDLGITDKPGNAPDVQTVPLPKDGANDNKAPLMLRGAIGGGPSQ
ncbi:uncharacterized protein YkwD [Rhizomicrobium palustre]|uniref:Uncharacterized protein YkwD n=1 Tax=Rhizomicrobium palustre TaxID=189966 RepID=A0A846MVV4_9PROT|nr:CAP domain-containing protein [Rhizomicrobium palustre]NIK87349.1 uncharacterized protein YkwD [Rhizomicrobium palustre]